MRFLIVGLGSIGRRHLKNLSALGQTDIILLRSRANYPPDDELNKFPVVTDIHSALEKKPDAVIISNPTALHLEVAIPAAQSGCPLLLEKPLSHNLNGTEQLRKIVRENRLTVLVGFQFRFHPGLQKIKEIISNQEIGRVLYFRSHWGEFLPGWHPWEDYRKGYSARQDLGGGVVLTLCHPLDYLHWLFGEVVELAAVTKKLSDLEIEVEDTAEILMNFNSGVLGCLHLDYIQQPPKHTLEIIGTNGSLYWDNSDGTVHHYQNAFKTWQKFPPREGFSRNDLFLEEMRHFIACVEGIQKPVCPLEDGIYVQKLIDTIYRSSMLHSFISVQ